MVAAGVEQLTAVSLVSVVEDDLVAARDGGVTPGVLDYNRRAGEGDDMPLLRAVLLRPARVVRGTVELADRNLAAGEKQPNRRVGLDAGNLDCIESAEFHLREGSRALRRLFSLVVTILVVLVLARDEVHGLAVGGRGKQIRVAVAVHVAEANCVETEVLERGQAGDRA
jgi:hypothetical protein